MRPLFLICWITMSGPLIMPFSISIAPFAWPLTIGISPDL
jgi:hypothetical protein